jgi:hypothetical protein
MKNIFLGILAFAVSITSIVLFVDWLNNHIDERVAREIGSEKIINSISANIHPYVLFNQRNTILFDGGAMDKYIDSIRTVSEQGMVMKVIVTPKRFLNIIPLLWCLDITEHTYRPRRGQRYEIVYELINANVYGLDEIRFRLEILK